MGRGPTHYCWHCYAANPVPVGRCAECGGAIEQPAGITYSEQLIWALGHRLAGTQMIAAQALQSLVSIVGVDGTRDLLEPLAESGPPAVMRVALHALNEVR